MTLFICIIELFLPVEPHGAGLLRIHPVMVQQQPNHFVVSVAGGDDEGGGPLPGQLGHVAQQVPGLSLRVVEQQRGQGQDSALARCLVHVPGQRLHVRPTGSSQLRRFLRN